MRKTWKVAAVALAALAAVGCAPRVGVRYAFDLRTPEGWLTHPNMGFRSGDRFRIRLVPDQDCYVYVLHQGTDGTYSMLFPVGALPNHVLEDSEVQVPQEGNLTLDMRAGVEKIHLLLSLRALEDLESLRMQTVGIHPDQFKAILKNVDAAYTIHGKMTRKQGPQYARAKIKGSPVLNCGIDIIHN